MYTFVIWPLGGSNSPGWKRAWLVRAEYVQQKGTQAVLHQKPGSDSDVGGKVLANGRCGPGFNSQHRIFQVSSYTFCFSFWKTFLGSRASLFLSLLCFLTSEHISFLLSSISLFLCIQVVKVNNWSFCLCFSLSLSLLEPILNRKLLLCVSSDEL